MDEIKLDTNDKFISSIKESNEYKNLTKDQQNIADIFLKTRAFKSSSYITKTIEKEKIMENKISDTRLSSGYFTHYLRQNDFGVEEEILTPIYSDELAINKKYNISFYIRKIRNKDNNESVRIDILNGVYQQETVVATNYYYMDKYNNYFRVTDNQLYILDGKQIVITRWKDQNTGKIHYRLVDKLISIDPKFIR